MRELQEGGRHNTTSERLRKIPPESSLLYLAIIEIDAGVFEKIVFYFTLFFGLYVCLLACFLDSRNTAELHRLKSQCLGAIGLTSRFFFEKFEVKGGN